MRLSIFAAALLATTPAFAVDAVTYRGTLGDHDIVVELASEIEGKMVGRYAYMEKGGDIPLTFMGRIGTPVLMAEEAPCTTETCAADDKGNVFNPPIGAFWSLAPSEDGATLTGTWEPANKSGKSLDIQLERIGQRTLPEDDDVTPYDMRLSGSGLIGKAERSFNPDTAPYEFAKQEVAFEKGPQQDLEGSTYRYVTDPRTGFAFPHVLSLADGSSVEPINAALEIRHAAINTFAFECLSEVYAGFGVSQSFVGFERGTLGGYDNEEIKVHYLSPTAMSWTESGSTFCGGAYPHNHADSYNLDTTTGEAFPMAKVFEDWTPVFNRADYRAAIDLDDALEWPGDYIWEAGPELIDFVATNRPVDEDNNYEHGCQFNELLDGGLGVHFAPGNQAVFRLEGLPHAAGACMGDLMTINIGDHPELLAPTAGDYFPDLEG